MLYEFLFYAISLIQSVELRVNYVLEINYSEVAIDTSVEFVIHGVFNNCPHKATFRGSTANHKSEWTSRFDCGRITNITILGFNTELVNTCLLSDGRDIYKKTFVKGRSSSIQRTCVAGWKPDYCDLVRYKISVKIKKKRAEDIRICQEDSFTINFVGSLDTVRASFGNFGGSENMVRMTVEKPDIGTLKEVSFDPQMCGDFHLGVIILESDVNIFRIYGGFHSKGSKQSSTNIRTTCKEGSRVFICNHVQYSIKLLIQYDEDIKTSESSQITIRGDRGSFKTGLKESAGMMENANIADITSLTLKNVDIFSTIQLLVNDIRREYNFSCHKGSKCELSSTICKLGWALGKCDIIEFRMLILSNGIHKFGLKVIGKGGFFVIHINKGDSSVGGIYYLKLKTINAIDILNLNTIARKSFTIRRMFLHYANYDGSPTIANLELYSGTRRFSTARHTVCLWRWAPGDMCGFQQAVVIVVTNTSGFYPAKMKVYSRNKDSYSSKFQVAHERVTFVTESFLRLNSSDVGTIQIRRNATLTNEKTPLIIYTAIQVFEISIASEPQAAVRLTAKYATTSCYPGLTGDKCMSICKNYTQGRGCQSCKCDKNVICDPMSGWCSSGQCKPRFTSPYCDWTCERGHFGLQCEHYSTNGGRCENFAEICDTGCSKVAGEKLCAVRCDGVYGVSVSCRKQCHCNGDVQCNKQTGKCPDKCQSGYYNREGEVDCQRVCLPGTFGVDCSQTCMCQNNKTCDVKSGKCLNKCMIGFFNEKGEDNCQLTCLTGSFGENCSKTCRCRNDEACHFQTGKCPNKCQLGYFSVKGERDCQRQCLPGTFGEGCSKTCMCANNDTCDIQSGQCPSGCVTERSGPDCQTEVFETKDSTISDKDIAIYASAGLLVVIFVFIAVCVGMRRKVNEREVAKRQIQPEPSLFLAEQPIFLADVVDDFSFVDEPTYTETEVTRTRSLAPSRSRHRRKSSHSNQRDRDDYSERSRNKRDDFSEATTRSYSTRRQKNKRKKSRDDEDSYSEVTRSKRGRKGSRSISRRDSSVSETANTTEKSRKSKKSKKSRKRKKSINRGDSSESQLTSRKDRKKSINRDDSSETQTVSRKDRKKSKNRDDSSETQSVSRKDRKKKEPKSVAKSVSKSPSKSVAKSASKSVAKSVAKSAKKSSTKSTADKAPAQAPAVAARKAASVEAGMALGKSVSFGHVAERAIAPRPSKQNLN